MGVMAHHTIEFDEACKSCKATGIYVGLAERDGSGVVCSTCRGTGKHHVVIEYDDFEGRHRHPAVRHVVEVNPGICIGRAGGKYRLSDFGGMPYEEWLMGRPFPTGSENRAFTCPAWWYQTADYRLKPNWNECGQGAFSACPSFPSKAQCWTRFDAER